MIIHLSGCQDTQYYSESYPHIFDRQTQWIVEKADEMKIKYVFHTGDLVDEYDKEEQWNNADQFMKTLDDAEDSKRCTCRKS